MENEIQAPVVEDSAVDADAQEWDSALEDFSSEKGVKAEEDKPAAKEEAATDEATDEQTDANKADEQATEQQAQPDHNRALREQRAAQRELVADDRAVRDDIKSQMFNDVNTTLADADGDPIRTIEDVQKLINPNTQQPFTEEEAAMWLMAAQQNLNRRMEDVDRQVETIAETNLTLKDEADSVKEKYGDLLASMPQLRDQVWKQFEATLIKDPNTGIITKAPVSIEAFYDTALAGYTKLAEQIQANEETTRQHQEQTAKLTRSDRADIYGAGTSNDLSGEDKEWAEAAKAHYKG